LPTYKYFSDWRKIRRASLGARRLSEGDPTDYALATIASILDQPASPPEAARVASSEQPEHQVPRDDADGYSKAGPGPMEAIRFKWTVRREAGERYFVDETIGEDSRSITSGPMSADAAVRFVDDQASEARQRFESLRNEMAGRAAAAEILRNKGGG
jgi:hypothetical protein